MWLRRNISENKNEGSYLSCVTNGEYYFKDHSKFDFQLGIQDQKHNLTLPIDHLILKLNLKFKFWTNSNIKVYKTFYDVVSTAHTVEPNSIWSCNRI